MFSSSNRLQCVVIKYDHLYLQFTATTSACHNTHGNVFIRELLSLMKCRYVTTISSKDYLKASNVCLAYRQVVDRVASMIVAYYYRIRATQPTYS